MHLKDSFEAIFWIKSGILPQIRVFFQKLILIVFPKVKLNPSEVIQESKSIDDFLDYLDAFLIPQSIQQQLPPSDVVGNIRFSHPTLYVFPGGQGDSALFGINGFNLLVDGGFSRKACFWDFSRHLDRLDAILITRISDDNAGGMSALLQRKTLSAVYPQIGHVFANLPHSDKLSAELTSKIFRFFLLNFALIIFCRQK